MTRNARIEVIAFALVTIIGLPALTLVLQLAL
jgi:hypothetical protein